MELSFEKMERSDLAEVLEIANQSFSHPWTREMFENELQKNPFSDQILVREGGRTVGYLFMMNLFDECHILDFAVHPLWRRKGIGRRILQYLIERVRSKGIRKIFLEVRSSNLPAILLYQNAGFAKTGTRKGYYSEPKEDALIFQWQD